MPQLQDKLIRHPDHMHFAHKGGWSSPEHTVKAREAAVLPILAGKTYEVTSLPLDDWGRNFTSILPLLVIAGPFCQTRL